MTSDGVMVSLGGRWAQMASFNANAQSALTQAQVARQSAEARLAAETARANELATGLSKLAELATSAAAETERLHTCERAACAEALRARATETVLASSLEVADRQLLGTRAQLDDAAAAHSLSERSLADAHTVIAEQRAALEVAAAALAAEQEVSESLRREATESAARSKRALLAKQEKERQLSVLQSEKTRLAGLLSKKDTLARELTLQIKKGSREGRPSPEPSPAADREATPTQDRRAAGAGGVWPAQHDAFVTPQVPGVQQRFAGWRDATPEQRQAALKAENAVLLCVLRERDVALAAAETECEKLKREAAAIRNRWRAVAQAGGKTPLSSPSASPSAASTPRRTPRAEPTVAITPPYRGGLLSRLDEAGSSPLASASPN